MKFHVGCSGWSYKHWAGDFYPEGLKPAAWFSYYASQFDTVELNATFYRLPSESAVQRWRDQAAEGFLFSAKVSRLITHFQRLKGSEGALRTYLERIGLLGDRLGPLLVQLPPNFEYDAARLDAFIAILPRDRRYAFEFRHASWWRDETYRILSGHDAPFCIYDRGKTATPVISTAPFAYVRFHGPEDWTRGYADRELSGWASRLRALDGVEEVFVYFNNDIGGHAPRDALRFRELVTGLRTRSS